LIRRLGGAKSQSAHSKEKKSLASAGIATPVHPV